MLKHQLKNMNYFIISDIHGSSTYLEKALIKYNEGHFDKLIILGDILYHGARNDLPTGYNTKKCIELLNKYKDEIIAVRGNCDSEVDQMVLDFNITSDYKIIEYNNFKIYITHGHKDIIKLLKKNDILLSGHTHIKTIKQNDMFLELNPGSLSLPKDDDKHSYATLIDGTFTILDIEGKILMKQVL